MICRSLWKGVGKRTWVLKRFGYAEGVLFPVWETVTKWADQTSLLLVVVPDRRASWLFEDYCAEVCPQHSKCIMFY